MRARPTFTIVLLAALGAAGLLPQPALASRAQQSLFQDDVSLLYSGDARRERTLDELRSLGVDVVRLNVRWNRYAPSPRSKRRPSFDATDPNAYPLGEVEAAVDGARARGMQVILTPTGPGPAWASRCSGSVNKRRICDPSPVEFGRYVTALGRRYPQVSSFSIWNEPNHTGWLTPQWRKRGGRYVRWSPHMYRGLVRAAIGALAATGHHDGDEILLGETAPIGRTTGSYFNRSVAPADFYRELFCLDSRGRRLGGRAARVRGCSSYQRLAVTGVAHHPYTRGAGQHPRSRPPGRGDITLAVISRLAVWLDRGARRGRVPRGLPIWLTEFGFQTNPPDRFAGVSLTTQARWLNESDWIAWRNGRIRSVAQYELRDERPRGAFQTGLRFVGGKAKPGLAAYRLPIWPVATRGGTRIWLHVRPQARTGTPQTVTIQHRSKRSGPWRTLGTATTNANGFVHTSTSRRARYWRFTWNGRSSRTASPASR
jgi:hypothetical protein